MTDKIDEVTAAIRGAIATRHQGLPKGGWDGLMRIAAISALEAMRSPTEDMIEAGESAMPPTEGYTTSQDVPRVWQAMIDAAIPN